MRSIFTILLLLLVMNLPSWNVTVVPLKLDHENLAEIRGAHVSENLTLVMNLPSWRWTTFPGLTGWNFG